MSESEVVWPTASMVLAVAFMPWTTHAVRVDELGVVGCGGAREGEFAVMLGERGGLPIVRASAASFLCC